MSNKKWRNPANGPGGAPGNTPPETATAPSGESHLRRLPDDYLETERDAGVEPGCYRTVFGAGKGLPDLRLTVQGLPEVGDAEALHDAQVEYMLRDTVRFLWQLVNMTSRVAETIRVGDLRRITAGEMALPGDMVSADGKISRHPDAYRVGGDKPAGEEPAKAPSRSRGRTHPFMTLLRLAIQAARLIKQITAGTHPTVHNRMRRDAIDALNGLKATEKWSRSVADGPVG